MPDITVSRITAIAREVCIACAGEEHDSHESGNYRIRGMTAYHFWTPSRAIGIFWMTRGFVVVRIHDGDFKRWWRPDSLRADLVYREEVKAGADGPKTKTRT